MATNKQAAEAILAEIAAVADARMRPMFGGYVIYVDEKVIGQFDENQLFFKVTPFGEQYAPELERASPYPGAKPAFIVPPERLEDTDWLREFIIGTRRQIK
jgi:TfoX/Sxy family transcriptional regulator of competence genes